MFDWLKDPRPIDVITGERVPLDREKEDRKKKIEKLAGQELVKVSTIEAVLGEEEAEKIKKHAHKIPIEVIG